MPLEQLLARYEMVRQEKDEAGASGRDSDDEDSLLLEEQPTVAGELPCTSALPLNCLPAADACWLS